MSTLTGADGAFKFESLGVAKVSSFTLNLNIEEYDDTSVGVRARTFVPGLFSATGTATLFVDSSDTAGRSLMNAILDRTGSSKQFEGVLNAATGQRISGSGFVTGVSATVSVGTTQSASITFRFSGDVDGAF